MTKKKQNEFFKIFNSIEVIAVLVFGIGVFVFTTGVFKTKASWPQDSIANENTYFNEESSRTLGQKNLLNAKTQTNVTNPSLPKGEGSQPL